MQEYIKSDLIGQLRELHSILFVPEHNEYFTLIQENKEEFEISPIALVSIMYYIY